MIGMNLEINNYQSQIQSYQEKLRLTSTASSLTPAGPIHQDIENSIDFGASREESKENPASLLQTLDFSEVNKTLLAYIKSVEMDGKDVNRF